MIREDIFLQFPELFGTKKVDGRDVNVEETIATLTRELRPAIAEALSARRALLESAEPVRRKYAWPRWEEIFEDPVTGGSWTFRQIVQGMIDNFLGRESERRWRLNDEVPIPADVHPLNNPGLELTGPWHPLDMAFNALNSDAPQNMPDFEDASPSHFQPQGTPKDQPVGTFAALRNAKEILEGRWAAKPYEVVKKDNKRSYKINRPPQKWPTRLVRPPSIHVLYDQITVDGQPAPGLIALVVLWVFNNYEALKQAGTGVYFYIPKMQTPREALIVEKLLARVEGIIGVPAGTFKIKILYEEGNGGRYLPAIAWVFRRRLLGTNVADIGSQQSPPKYPGDRRQITAAIALLVENLDLECTGGNPDDAFHPRQQFLHDQRFPGRLHLWDVKIHARASLLQRLVVVEHPENDHRNQAGSGLAIDGDVIVEHVNARRAN